MGTTYSCHNNETCRKEFTFFPIFGTTSKQTCEKFCRPGVTKTEQQNQKEAIIEQQLLPRTQPLRIALEAYKKAVHPLAEFKAVSTLEGKTTEHESYHYYNLAQLQLYLLLGPPFSLKGDGNEDKWIGKGKLTNDQLQDAQDKLNKFNTLLYNTIKNNVNTPNSGITRDLTNKGDIKGDGVEWIQVIYKEGEEQVYVVYVHPLYFKSYDVDSDFSATDYEPLTTEQGKKTLDALKQNIVAEEMRAGGKRDMAARRAFNVQLRALRVLRG